MNFTQIDVCGLVPIINLVRVITAGMISVKTNLMTNTLTKPMIRKEENIID
jgi:hypothetical protein